MNEETAFLRGLEESPNDDALRLVFADWLEEHCDPRGELLHLMHRLTQVWDGPQRTVSEVRLQALLQEGVQPLGPFRTNRLGMKFAWVPAGTFLMGSPDHEQDRLANETQHRVILTKGFFLGIHPVTRAQWQAVMGKKKSLHGTGRLPVVEISWYDSLAFCEKLSKRDGESYRLPTEAEWEYACRAGSSSAYCFGDYFNHLGDYAWFMYSAGFQSPPRPVGQKKPNAWGLFDMHGNVGEWCWDWSGEYTTEDAIDPEGSPTGRFRVQRGGSTRMFPWQLRSAVRCRLLASNSYEDVGFRVCFGVD